MKNILMMHAETLYKLSEPGSSFQITQALTPFKSTVDPSDYFEDTAWVPGNLTARPNFHLTVRFPVKTLPIKLRLTSSKYELHFSKEKIGKYGLETLTKWAENNWIWNVFITI
jgi:hypothetical protein